MLDEILSLDTESSEPPFLSASARPGLNRADDVIADPRRSVSLDQDSEIAGTASVRASLLAGISERAVQGL